MGQPPGSGAPVYRILGGHHGDEWSSFEVPLAVAETLAAGDQSVPEITAILDRATVWIAPYINPDGVIDGSRYNATFVDVNRNYDFMWNAMEFAPGDYAFSEPESQAVRANSHYDLPFAGLSYHSGATNIGYVWNYTVNPAPDRDRLIEVAAGYRDATGDPAFWVTNGADWYITSGDTNDWSYGRYGVLDFTVEVTEEKSPPPSEIANYVPGHVDAAIAFLSREPQLSGVVVDDTTGRPIMAHIALDSPAAPFFTDPIAGAFHRWVDDGPVELSVSAAGYETTTATVIAPADGLEIRLTSANLRGDSFWGAPILEESTLPFDGDSTLPVELTRPGSDPVLVLPQRGELFIDPDRLARGAWTVQIGQQTWVRGLIIADELLASVQLDQDTLILDGRFDAGSRVWSLDGVDRALRPLEVVQESGQTLVVDAAGVPTSGRVDVMVLSGGRHSAFTDIHDIEVDLLTIEDDVIIGLPVGCACATGTGHLGLHLLSVLVLIPIRRRSQ